MMTGREILNTWGEGGICCSAFLPTSNSTWIATGLKTDPDDKKLAFNCISPDTAILIHEYTKTKFCLNFSRRFVNNNSIFSNIKQKSNPLAAFAHSHFS
jgi:hypothetical protein